MRSLVTVSPCNFLLSSIAGWATCFLLPYRSNHPGGGTPAPRGPLTLGADLAVFVVQTPAMPMPPYHTARTRLRCRQPKLSPLCHLRTRSWPFPTGCDLFPCPRRLISFWQHPRQRASHGSNPAENEAGPCSQRYGVRADRGVFLFLRVAHGTAAFYECLRQCRLRCQGNPGERARSLPD